MNQWKVCASCLGRGKKSRKLSKKMQQVYQAAYQLFLDSNGSLEEPIRPKASQMDCTACYGLGIIPNAETVLPNFEKLPRVAIIGAGIGGVALAVACLHRGIPFTLYERDANFSSRSQGYGLTLQQANRILKKLGIPTIAEGIISTKHVVHTSEGEIVGEWGGRKWVKDELEKHPKRSNMHVARQTLRQYLIAELGGSSTIAWGHQLVEQRVLPDGRVKLKFNVHGEEKCVEADLLVGADGIRSIVREQVLGKEVKPLRYLQCLVMLGICPLEKLGNLSSPLLDGHTVFQTANGKDRIYIMPYSKDAIMCQLSCPMSEEEAKVLSSRGAQALKEEAINRTPWHSPIPEIIRATEAALISGYPVYDRETLDDELERSGLPVTLLGDAAHPMSPFKGQGANQALLDALALANQIYTTYQYKGWKNGNIRQDVLNDFEKEMIARSAVKVEASAAAVEILHSEKVFEGGNQPRAVRQN